MYDNELSEIRTTTPGLIDKIQMDLDKDGLYEFILLNRTDYQTVTIYRHDLSGSIATKLPSPCGANSIFRASYKEDGDKAFLHIQRAENNYIYKYYRNKYYILKFPIYYIILLLIVIGIQRLQKFQTERKMAIEKQISELQLKTIRSQMDPHFTFNALNTISSIIYKGDKEQAHRYFTKFSKLVRATLNAADKITRYLWEELDFVENYLILEKIRFKDKFNYSINVSENVNKSRLIPKMIIQIYVENAVKHGLKHKEKNGLLTIAISEKDKNLIITIEDNGIGRKRAKEMKTFGTGKGLNIMNNIFLLYNKLHKVKISQSISDLFDEKGNPAGTRVEIIIPAESNPSL
jgi:LytS/YehU family sensor histidine kinase